MDDERSWRGQIRYLIKGFLSGGYIELLFVLGAILFGFGVISFVSILSGNFSASDELDFFLVLTKWLVSRGLFLTVTSCVMFYLVAYLRVRKKRKLKPNSS